MKLQLITIEHVNEAVKYLVSGKDGDHLPYTGDDGSPNHRLMGAAWAALHGGYRGNKYEGSDKAAAITKLKALYKSEKMDTPEESAVNDISGGVFFQEALAKSDSFDSIRCKVMDAIAAKIKAGIDMDGDDDGAADSGQCTCGCPCGSKYNCSCCSNCTCTYPKYAWCQDLFPGVVVYSMDSKLMQCEYSIDADGDVQLGDPQEVEMSYTPVADRQTAANESFRTLAVESMSLQESAYDAGKGELTVTVIQPGMSKNRRNYSAGMLKKSAKIFEGAKMFADHQTESEAKSRPEGSVNNWVATLNKTWAEGDGTVKGTATVIDPQFKAKLDRLKETGNLNQMGVSIRAIGEASKSKDADGEYVEVESIVAARSVDFVTHAGAGGRVEAMESQQQSDEWDVDLITEADFRKRRPDLVKLIESSAQGAKEQMKSLEQQLQESNAQLAAKTKELTEANTKLAESEKTAKKAAASAELTKLLSESKLPEPAQKRIQKQFAEALSTDGMKEAIDDMKELTKTLSSGSGVKHMGAGANGTQESDGGSNNADHQKLLVEAYQSAGMSEKEAKLAAGVA
jgi:hypothetical protein